MVMVFQEKQRTPMGMKGRNKIELRKFSRYHHQGSCKPCVSLNIIHQALAESFKYWTSSLLCYKEATLPPEQSMDWQICLCQANPNEILPLL